MEYTRLGNSGLYISKIILGTATFGSSKWQPWVLEEEAALPILEHAFKMGINTWDTADAYSNGRSEEIIGKALKKFNIPRPSIVIMTKIFYAIDPVGQTPISANMTPDARGLVNRVGLSRKHILDAVAASCERLGTYIDVLQIHRLDRLTPPEEIMRALNDIVESGQVRYIGASSMACWEFQKLQNIAERNGWHKFISMQPYYNLLYREEEREMVPYCRDSRVGIIPWSPLARGVLAHAWKERGTKREMTDNMLKEVIRGKGGEVDEWIVGRVEEVAKRNGVSMAVVGLAWCMRKGVWPIAGLNNRKRIDEAVEAVGFELSDEDVGYLEELYVPKEVTM
ncbi:related to aryl-alcohol dehydrogenases [Phialocephala subalpina]|uniref:Related to aryl-alcohol dehydrogenases n=1 Tax=Phialocephala subalpina TaxID=576137 RepID=A0A1L7XA15_9HELO|nr:related to aryl-alcohol dehydrogenases [Phialocephala subalpina]